MKNILIIVALAASALPAPGLAHDAVARETVTLIAEKRIPNVPGKRLVSLVVDYAPGVSSVPHRHAQSARDRSR